MKSEIEWFDIKKCKFDHFKDYLVTDGYYVEIKWFNGIEWDSWSELHSDIDSEDITHFAELPFNKGNS